jgi:hypothetical protein
VLGAGETVVSRPGEPHTVGPAGETAVEMVVEFRPALGFEAFVERTYASAADNSRARKRPYRRSTCETLRVPVAERLDEGSAAGLGLEQARG